MNQNVEPARELNLYPNTNVNYLNEKSHKLDKIS